MVETEAATVKNDEKLQDALNNEEIKEAGNNVNMGGQGIGGSDENPVNNQG